MAKISARKIEWIAGRIQQLEGEIKTKKVDQVLAESILKPKRCHQENTQIFDTAVKDLKAVTTARATN